ncbi:MULTISPECIES: AraC family transcriptional regulator [unclassified Allomuricauda]|uniref:helix-turn-helix domain-containing protein n=2 Tax=Allomuricauda TaxID=111500 RepID=UPI00273F03CB|nr:MULTISPECIES: AraC family transcriptional regulator [unclassified Allomuricauda]
MSTNLLLHYANILLIFTSIFFAFFLLYVKSSNKIGNILLSIFLIIRTIDILPSTFSFLELTPVIDVLRMDIGAFFQAPLLFLFTLSIIYSDFKLSSKHLVLLIPFLVNTVILFPRFYLENEGEQLLFYNNYTNKWEGKLSYVLAHFQNIVYIIVTFVLLHRYKKLLLENYSKSTETNYSWLFQMNMICLLLFIFALVKNIYRFGSHFGFISTLRLSTSIIMLGFTCWLIFKALNAPKLFRGISSNLQLASALPSNHANPELGYFYDVKAELKKFMLEKEPYLDPDLTIKSLAHQMKMEQRELSVLINTELNMNFYEFINLYRIDKAKALLKDEKFLKLTILEILYQVGYNSKSSFNTAFKKTTGITPSAYRKKFHKKEFE